MTNRRSQVLRASVALALGASAWVGSAAVAQTSAVLEEIVVTAQRRTENLQQVPVAVSAMSSQQLLNAGVQSFSDMEHLTPSLTVSESPAARYLNIRGVGIGVSTPFQAAGVPLHLDGMYIPRSEQYLSEAYFDLDSIQILRGPQGTFAGQNSTGGAIFIVSKQPEIGDFNASIQQLVGNYNWYQTQGFMNMPISENTAARIAVNTETRNGFNKNHGPGGYGLGLTPQVLQNDGWDRGELNRTSLRAIFRYMPSDDVDIRLRYDWIRDHTNGSESIRTIPGTYNNPDLIPNIREYYNDFPSYSKTDLHRVMLNTSWQLSKNLQLKTVTGYQYSISNSASDTDGTSPYQPSVAGIPNPPSTQTFGVVYQTDTYAFQEFDLLSTSDSPLQWVAGIVGLVQKTPIKNLANIGYVAQATTPPIWDYNLVTSGSWLFYNQRHNSYAAFGEITYNFSDQWQVIVGGRYTYDSTTLDNTSAIYSAAVPNGISNSCPIPIGKPPGPCYLFAYSNFDAPTGRVAVNWKPNTDTTVYFTVGEGFKPGSYQTQFTLQSQGKQPQYNQEEILNFELGAKTTVLDGHLRINGDVYYEKYNNYQAQFAIAGAPIPRSIPMQDSTIKGVELQLQALVGAATFELNGGYNKTEITTGAKETVTIPACTFYGISGPPGTPPPPTCSPAQTLLPDVNFVGYPLNFAPKLTYNAAVEYAFDLGDSGTLTPRLQYSHTDEQWARLFHASQDYVPARSLLDFRLTYRAPEHWRVEGFVTNVTDELYVAGVIAGTSQPDASSLALGAPRQFGVRIQYNYK